LVLDGTETPKTKTIAVMIVEVSNMHAVQTGEAEVDTAAV
jgi:hypothetical protein